MIERGLEISKKLQFQFGLASAYVNMCELYRREGDFIQAGKWLDKSMGISRDLGLQEQIAFNLNLFGLLALHRNDYPSAIKYLRGYFEFHRAFEEKISFYRFLIGMSAVAGRIIQPKPCAKLYGAAQSAMAAISDFQTNPFDRAEFDRHIRIARG